MDNILEINGLTCFSEDGKTLLKDLSFQVKKQECIALLGHNGSGKSSLMKLLSAKLKNYNGEVFFYDEGNKKKPLNFFSEIILLSQDVNKSTFPSLSVRENCLLALGYKNSHQNDYEDYIHEFYPGLLGKLDALVSSLSGGERQVLALLMCFFKKPRLLLLDEHTSALDPLTANALTRLSKQLLKNEKITCIMITHNLKEAIEMSSRIIALKQGKLCFDEEKTDKIDEVYLQHNCY